MPQPIANNILTTPISGSIERAAMSLAIEGQDRDYGNNYSGLDWYSSITPLDGKYVIISKSIGTGLPTHWVTADDTDAELLYTINRLPAVANNLTFTDTGSALEYLTNSNRYIVLRSMPNNSDADAVLFDGDANNLSSYPRTGSGMYNISGNSIDMNLYNSPSYNNGGWLDFDGIDDYGQASSIISPSTGPFSVEIIYKLTAQGRGGLFERNQGSPYNGWSLGQGGTSNWAFTVSDNGLVNSLQANYTYPTFNLWYHDIATYNGSNNVKGYRNGELIDNVTGIPQGNLDSQGLRQPLRIFYRDAGSSPLRGDFVKARIYNKELSESDVKQNYFGGPIVTDGLKLMVDASNLVSYESGSSTTYSLTGSYTGSFFNGTGYSPNNGGAFDFDGVNDEIRVQVNGWIRTVDDITVMGFVQIPSGASLNGGPWSIMTDHPTVSDRDGFWWHLNLGGNVYFRVEDDVNGEQGIIFGASPLSSGNTYHLTTVVGQNEVKVYVDGEFLYGYNPPFMWSQVSNSYTAELFLGRTYPNYYLNCNLPSVLVYDRALTEEEIGQNYNAQKQKYQL